MKILLLGGTGVIGRELISLLRYEKHDLHVTTRRHETSVPHVTFHRGNAQDDQFLSGILKQRWDVIIDFMSYTTPQFAARMELLLCATEQYMLTSSARIFAQSEMPLTESSLRLLDVSTDKAYLQSDEYALTKARQEDLLTQSAFRNWTIIRPYITFGQDRLQLGTLEKEGWLFRALKRRPIVFCESMLDQQTTLTQSHDVARMIVTLLSREKALSNSYNLTTAQTVTWRDVLELYRDIVGEFSGSRPDLILLNTEQFMSIVPNSAQVKYDRLYHRVFDPTKITALCEQKDNKETLSALSQSLKDFLSKDLNFKPINWRQEGRFDSYSRSFTKYGDVGNAKQYARYLLARYKTKTS